MNIYVGNLSYRMNDKDLEATFAKFGAVKSAKVIMDKETGRSKGFAFVEMADVATAQAAIAQFDGYTLLGRQLRVNESQPRGGGYGGRGSSGNDGGSRSSGGGDSTRYRQ